MPPGRAGADLPPSFGCPGSPSEWGWERGFLGHVRVMGDESPDTLAQVSPGGPQSSEVPDTQWAAFVVWSFAWHCGRAEGGRGRADSFLPPISWLHILHSQSPPPTPHPFPLLSFPSFCPSPPSHLLWLWCSALWLSVFFSGFLCVSLSPPSLNSTLHGPCLYFGWAPRHRRKSCDPKSSDFLTTKAWPLRGEPSLSGRRWERGMGPSLREAFRGKSNLCE